MEESRIANEIISRKSLTNWTKEKIDRETWMLLFEAARFAPSSWNHQPARYVAVTENDNIQSLSQCLHRTNRFATKAAGLIVQVANPDDDDRVDGKDYYLYDCGLAMMSLVYQATVLGLTVRQMIGWDEAGVKACLNIPNEYRIVVITALGYPSSSPVKHAMSNLKRTVTSQHKRHALKYLLSWESWEVGKKDE